MNNSFFEQIYNHPSLKKPDYKAIIDAQTKVEFSKNEIAQIIMQISAINTWNRIAVATHLIHEK